MELKYKDYNITVDEYQFHLWMESREKPGSNRKHIGMNTIGYYTSFERMLKKIVKLELLKKKDITDLHGYLKHYQQLLGYLREEIVEPLEID